MHTNLFSICFSTYPTLLFQWIQIKFQLHLFFLHCICRGAALNKQYLKLIGVTHVLNAAEGSRLGQVNTCERYYFHVNDNDGDGDDDEDESGESAPAFKYMGLNLIDLPGARICDHFTAAADWMDAAIRVDKGRVLVHCLLGISRSSTIVIAYLMLKRDLTLVDAIRVLRKQREIAPNDGFLRQLIELEAQQQRVKQSHKVTSSSATATSERAMDSNNNDENGTQTTSTPAKHEDVDSEWKRNFFENYLNSWNVTKK